MITDRRPVNKPRRSELTLSGVEKRSVFNLCTTRRVHTEKPTGCTLHRVYIILIAYSTSDTDRTPGVTAGHKCQPSACSFAVVK